MSDRDTIFRLRMDLLKAFNEEDIDTMASFLSDDHVGMPPNRPALKGKEVVRQFWREGFALARSRFTIMPEELVVAGDIAIDRFRWTTDSTLRAGGSPAHDEGTCIWIWRRQPAGDWKVARSIWNSDLAAAGLWSGAAAAGSA